MNSILATLKRPLHFLDEHRNMINSFLPFFFLSYFVLVFLPYIVADVPFLNSFFMGSITKLIFRTFTTTYLCLYGLMVGYVNKQGIKWQFIVCGFILVFCYVLSIIIAPKYYSYVLLELTHRVELYDFYIGTYSYITYGFSFFADVVSFVIFISYVPSAMKSVRQLYLTLFFVVAFMVVACAYSMIKEHAQIIQLLKGASEYNVTVRSFFHSKNAFGLYLFIGSFSAAFLLMSMYGKIRWLFALPLLLFLAMCFCSLCKSALLCCLILNVLVIWYFAFFSKGISFYISLFLMVLSVLAMMLIILVVTIPSLKEEHFPQLYGLLVKLFNGLFTRTERWGMAKYVVYGPFIIIGMNESNTTYFLEIMSKILQNNDVTDFHSAYITWYAHHGIIGSVIYGMLIGYIIYDIVHIYKNNKSYGFLLTILLLVCFVFMVPESYVLFISISSYTFVVNIVLICCTEHLLKKGDTNMESVA